MMKNKNSFVIYIDSLDVLDLLTDEQCGKLFKMIRSYHRSEPLVDDPLLKVAFLSFQNYFERNADKYDKKCHINQQNGQKGGRPRKTTETQNNPVGFYETQHNPKKPDSDSDSDSDSVSDSDSDKSLIVINHNIDVIQKKETGLVKSDDYSQFIAMFNSITGRQYRGDTKSKAAFNARKKQGWTLEQFDKAIRNVMTDRYHIESNLKYLTPEFITREDKLDKFHAQADAPVDDVNRKLLKGTTVQQHNEGLERFKAIMEAKNNGTGQPS